ncbi:MAG: glycosyltransferase, partial [Bacteroidales bacterium]|nr:glycosyltransferase [Bacteroidales bacterium]
MRKILIAIHYMEIGGAEMSLLGLLESLDFSEVQVDLFVYNHKGDLMRHIPPQVNVLPEIPEYKQIERPVKDVLK